MVGPFVKIIVGNSKTNSSTAYFIHRNVLTARSNLFKTTLFATTSFDHQARLTLEDVQARTLLPYIQYIYSGTLPYKDDDETIEFLGRDVPGEMEGLIEAYLLGQKLKDDEYMNASSMQ